MEHQALRRQKCTFPLMQSGTLELSSAASERLERLHSGIGVSIMEVLQLHQQQWPRLPSGTTTGALSGTPEPDGLELATSVPRSGASDTGGSLNAVGDSDSDSGIDFAEEDAPLSSTRSISGDSESFSCSSRSSLLVPGHDTDGADDGDDLAPALMASLNLGASPYPATYHGAPSTATSAEPWPRQRFAVLSYDQVRRLHDVMNEVVLIHGRGNFPTLELRLRDLVNVVRTKLEADSVVVKDIRLNGGAASYVLTSSGSSHSPASDSQQQTYNDLDLIFGVDLSSPRSYDRIKNAVLESLLDFLPPGVSRTRMLSCALKEAYVSKMVKVTEGDRWSLISLGNHRGKNVELKFVHHMRRQFEFSVDSFQIILDSLLLFYDCAAMPIGETFYPTVVGESVYADFREALHHLTHKLIATRNPEEIRGGGLLKYCNLLVKDYQPANPSEIKTLERYMCSRFFIDFPDINQQRSKLENYLWNHFIGTDEALKYDFLMILYSVVDDSTVCLMGHERRQTLTLIEELACQAYYADQQAAALHQQSLAVAASNASSQQQQQQQQSSSSSSNAPSSGGATHMTLAGPPPTYHHAPVYEVRISGCQPTVVYSSSGYFYAPIMTAHPHAPPPPSAPASNPSAACGTAASPAPSHTSAAYAGCHPGSCSCTCGWIACS